MPDTRSCQMDGSRKFSFFLPFCRYSIPIFPADLTVSVRMIFFRNALTTRIAPFRFAPVSARFGSAKFFNALCVDCANSYKPILAFLYAAAVLWAPAFCPLQTGAPLCLRSHPAYTRRSALRLFNVRSTVYALCARQLSVQTASALPHSPLPLPGSFSLRLPSFYR